MFDSRPVLGIDLGTCNSAAATLVGDRPTMLLSQEGATEQGVCFPSVVEFDGQGRFVCAGESARRSMPIYPELVVCGVKRLIGRSFEQAKAAGDTTRFGYRTLQGPDGGCLIQVGPVRYTPTEITSLILRKIKRDAEAEYNPIGRAVSEAVITVPAYFDPWQKSETERAAQAAGFARVLLVPEPTAAASAYRLCVEQENQYIVVIDLGAGTLDVTVALLFLDDSNQLQTLEKGHGGDTTLGGMDMDDALWSDVVRRYGLARVVADARAAIRLRWELERAKIELSTADRSEIVFGTQQKPVRITLTRGELETAVRPIVERCRGPIRVALQEAGLAPSDVAHVLLVGGPTLMPVVRHMVADEFRTNPRVVEEIRAIDTEGFPVNPMEAVARGAVLGVAGRVTPHGYGVLLDDAYFELLPRGERYPCGDVFAFEYGKAGRTLTFGVVREAVDPHTRKDEYTLLGTFQFDFRPGHGPVDVHIEWEFTENGCLDFQLRQPQSQIDLPLYEISRLQGRRIPAPRRCRLAEHDGERSFVPRAPRQSWTAAEREQAVATAARLLDVWASRSTQVSPEPRAKIDGLVKDLKDWLGGSLEEVNVCTPQIRDLNRAVLNLMRINRLVTSEELAELQEYD